jgi:hydrogenase maturation protein HypF
MSFVRQYITIEGIVQGVGFRPFIYRLAKEYQLSGHVANNGGVVEILAIGKGMDVDEFLRQIPLQAPPLSHIYRINTEVQSPQPDKDENNKFTILSSQAKFSFLSSQAEAKAARFISPDLAICPNCRRELFDQKNRRYRHMFNTCTDCGPRFSVIKTLPYDRENTTMDVFPMCVACEEEYFSPAFRRFHAETISCKECGPKIKFVTERGDIDDGSKQMSEVDLTYAVKSIKEGRVIAIKGIGGYHFACSPMNAEAVRALRRLKGRETKPFAIMFSSLDFIRKYCDINPEEEAALTSPAAPITLLPMKSNPFPEEVLCGNSRMGCFLPYTPLHVLLLEQLDMLILTSANRSGSAILYKDDELLPTINAISSNVSISSDCSAATESVVHSSIQVRNDIFWSGQLHGILTHNRDILRPLEDSVVQWNHKHIQYLRTGRGSSPTVFTLPAKPTQAPSGQKVFKPSGQKVFRPEGQIGFRPEGQEFIALGGDLKAAFCVVKNGQAYLSQYFGDLEDETAMKHYTDEIQTYLTLFDVHPEFIICDKHPGYHSTKLALTFGLPVVQIQHHHAHGASVLAEYQLYIDAICVCFDGTGYGEDQHIWGGEIFIYHRDTQEFERAAHLSYTELLGGDSSAKDAVKTALCFQYKAGNQIGYDNNQIEQDYSQIEQDYNQIEQDYNQIEQDCNQTRQCLIRTLPSAIEFESVQSADEYKEKWRKRMKAFDESADIVCAALAQHINTAKNSSIGRLFDAVAALLFLSPFNEYEGKCAQMLEQAAAEAESMGIDPIDMNFHIYHTKEGWIMDETPIIRQITACQEEILSYPRMTRAAALGFHLALAKAVYEICQNLSLTTGIRTIILSGGVFQNRLLTRALTEYLEEKSFQVHRNTRSIPNDNGIALGQAYLGWMRR